jgi:hypothetical protein
MKRTSLLQGEPFCQSLFHHTQAPNNCPSRIALTKPWYQIDSLCIMQQDEEDWRLEASKMSQVYSNSSLNLAASDSPDGDTGLFFKDRPNILNVWKVTFPRSGPVPKNMKDDERKERSKQYTWNCINGSSRAIIDDSTLAIRAWTLQERFLPARTLYFGRNQVAWECRLGNAYEALSSMFDEGIMRSSPGNFHGLLHAVNPFAYTENVRQWDHLVQIYSKRLLSFRKDKLVAISGLARMFAPLYKSDYVAGLWVKDLVRLMAWIVYTKAASVTEHVEISDRAPSWSWASVDGEIQFSHAMVSPLEGSDMYADEDLLNPPLAKVLSMFD